MDLDFEEIYYLENKFNKKGYNTLIPNGYNLNKGGAKGKDSKETRLLKKQTKLGKKNSQIHIENSRFRQIGNRRNKKKTKYQEDEELPKYIISIRYKGNLVGYSIKNFPIGVTKKKYLTFNYRSTKNTPTENLTLAMNKLKKLKKEYNYVNNEIIQKKKSVIDKKIQNKMQNNKNLKKLPEFIHRIFTETGKIKGYKVKYKNNEKIFIEKTNKWNLNSARKYLKLCKIKEINSQFIIPQLPPHVYLVKDKYQNIIGFEMRKSKQKKITHPFLTLEQKYNKILNEKSVTDSQD